VSKYLGTASTRFLETNDISVTKFLGADNGDISVTKFLGADNGDISVTKFLKDTSVTKFMDSSADNTLTSFLD